MSSLIKTKPTYTNNINKQHPKYTINSNRRCFCQSCDYCCSYEPSPARDMYLKARRRVVINHF